MEQKQILQEKQNNFFNRKEVKVLVESPTSPSVNETKEFATKNFNAKQELVKVNKIKGKFGRNTFLINLDIYNSEEDRLKHDPKYKQEKAKLEEERKKAEAEKLKQEQEAKAAEETQENKEQTSEETPKENSEVQETKQEENKE